MVMQEESETWLPNVYSKQTIKMWSLKSVVIWTCESRTSLHAVQYKWQPGFVLMFCPYYFRNGYSRHFVLIFSESLALFLVCS